MLFLASIFVAATVCPTLADDSLTFFLGGPIAVALVVGLIWSVVLGVLAVRRRDWCVAVPLLSCSAIAVVFPYALLDALTFPGYAVKVATHYPAYERQMARVADNGHRFAEWDWGGLTFVSIGVTYDETDEVARPFGRQSGEWINRMKSTDLTCGLNGPYGRVQHLRGHYYLTTFGC